MQKIYNVTEFAEMIGKSVKTLQRWDNEGILKAYRSPSNRRYYTQTQYNEYIGIKDDVEQANVIYARVSSRNQDDDLKNQIKFLNQYIIDNAIPISNIIFDIGSGMNYNRKNWNSLIEDCFRGKISKILISHKDRFMRFGFSWFASFLEKMTGVQIIIAENIATTPEKELIGDLVAIIDVFSCRVDGLRKYKKKISKVIEDDESI
jgi:Predicted site-specific integrase-resolvase|nr:MAG TPA: serine recombinase [Caudoviricetes sp.]